jgi:hypothetical protein
LSTAALIRRGWVAVGLALAFELAVALIDSLTDRVILTTVFVVAPVALAAVGTPSQVAAIGLLSIALALVSGLWDQYFLAVDHVTRVLIVVTGSALAVVGARARARAEHSAVREAAAREEQEHARRDAEASRAGTSSCRRTRESCSAGSRTGPRTAAWSSSRIFRAGACCGASPRRRC